MNRIDAMFRMLRKGDRAALIPFITCGDPDLATTEKLIHTISEAGADLIEIGLPFSDPLADGPTIQAASQRALLHGVNAKDLFALVKRVRRSVSIPLVVMGYYNPVLQYGLQRFAKEASEAGVDGTIIPDLPLEEVRPWEVEAGRAGLANIMLIAPNTPPDRIEKISRASKGFVYYVSVTGITGARTQLPLELSRGLKLVKSLTNKPVAVGFGISRPEQVSSLAGVADGIIVGSAIIKVIEKHLEEREGKFLPREGLVEAVGHFVSTLRQAC